MQDALSWKPDLRARQAHGGHVLTTVVAGFHNASLASDLPLNAASTSLSSHAVFGKVGRLNNRAVTPAPVLLR